MNREHGPDFGRWRQWAMPDNPPKPIDFVIAGVTSGNHKNQMWEANRLALKDYRDNGGVLGLYHFYESVNALSQIKILMECVAELSPQFVAIDFEPLYSGQVLTETDVRVTKDIVLGLYQYFPKDKVLVYCSHDKWVNLLLKYDFPFFSTVEMWLTWPNPAGEDTVAFHPVYAPHMGREFDEVRIFQYSWDGDAQAYGVLNEPKKIDLNVYPHKQPFSEWVGNQPQPPEETMGILEDMNAKLDKILALMEAGGGTTPPPPPPPPPPDTIGKKVDRDGQNVFLFFAASYNQQGAPWLQIYPSNTSDVKDRIWVPSGTTVQVYADGRVVGDGNNVGWRVDKSQLVASGAPTPPDVVKPDNEPYKGDLFVMEKFIV